MTPVKGIGAFLCALLLIPILVIGAVAGDLDTGVELGSLMVPTDLVELDHAVLTSPRIALTSAARHDIEAGAVNPRVLELLLVVAQAHRLGPVGPFITGHPRFVAGTSIVSNHVYGRAADIAGVDGMAVSMLNLAAREVMAEILALSPPLLPDELGGPWLLPSASTRVFTKDHGDHIHIGWNR